MSVSEPFIRRPIATSLVGDCAADRRRARLLGAAGVGAAAGRFPDRAGDDAAARRQPRRDCLADHSAAGAPARADPVAVVDAIDEFVRRQPDLAAVRSQPRHRRRDAGRAGRDQCGGRNPAENPAVPADLRQGQSGGCARDHAGADLGDDFAARDERYRRYDPGPAAEPDFRRRPRLGAGRAEARGAGAGGSGAARRLRHRDGGFARRHCRRQRLRSQGIARRRAAILHHRRQRPDRGRRKPTSRSSSPIATARRSRSATSPSSSTGWRTTAPAAGTRARRPSSSTSSGSPAPM